MYKRIDDPSLTLEEAGKKAFSLKELAASGQRVPPGFVVPPQASIDPVALLARVHAAGGFPVAVRSSANLEDLEGASFAGQYQTFLDVSSVEALIRAILDCRASGGSSVLRSYLAARGLENVEPRVSVLVQRMVPARWAGVAFTIHPLTGREEEGLIEYCEGLGERLVSGHVQPSRISVELRTGRVVSKETGDVIVALPEPVVRELAERSLEIQAHFHQPQDIEWAADGEGTLWILQSRPVTALSFRTDVDEFTNADFKDGGVSARVCTPLMYSLYREAMQVSMPAYFRAIGLLGRDSTHEEWIGCYYGRPYWNASAVKRAMARVPGWDEAAMDADLGIRKTYGPAGPVRVPVNPRTVLPAIPVALLLERELARCLREVPAFLARFDAEETRFRKEARLLRSMDDARLLVELGRIIELQRETETTYFNVIYNSANAQTGLRSLLRSLDRETGSKIEVVRLLGGLTDVSHLEMQRDLLHLCRTAKGSGLESAEFERALHLFLERNYFHGDAELELMTPRWGEDPSRVEQMVAAVLRSGSTPADPDVTTRKQRKEFEAEVAAIRKRISASWLTRLRFGVSFARRLERARSYLSLREATRERSSKAYALFRVFLLEAARRWHQSGLLDEEAQAFMLHLPELRELLSRPAKPAIGDMLKGELRFRRLMYDAYSAFAPPNELGRGTQARKETAVAPATGALQGLGCSPGRVQGPARVVHSLAEIGEIRSGEILVTRFTDPGWTPVLGMVKGVVTEVGGLLSHAAVIGREYGIPAVLNLAGATRRIRTGDLIDVDGTTGAVLNLGPAPLARSAPGEREREDYRHEREIEESLTHAPLGRDAEGSREQPPVSPAR